MESTVDLAPDLTENRTKDNATPFYKMHFKEKLAYAKDLITIEPLLIFYQCASIVCGTAITALRYDMACRKNAGYNETICKIIVASEHEENGLVNENNIVQQHLAAVDLWSTPVTKVVPVLLLLFIGTFSDNHKIRKPFLLIPIIGEFFAVAFCLTCTAFLGEWPVEIETISQVIVPSLLGSPDVIYATAYAYVCDISEPEMRIVRLAIITICTSVWTPIGLFISAALYEATGYVVPLLLALICFICAFVYGLFMVTEPKETHAKEDIKTLLKDIANIQHVKETLMVLCNPGKNQRFNMIFICMVIFVNALRTGDGIPFLYIIQLVYGMSPSEVTNYTAAWRIALIIGLAVGIPLLSKVLFLSDLTIIIISLIDALIINILYVQIRTSCALYLIVVIGILTAAADTGVTSQVTKYVKDEDIGKVQSLIMIISAVGATIGTQLYVPLYDNTRETNPFAFFYVSILLIIIAIIILGIMYARDKYFSGKNKTEISTEMERKKSTSSTSTTKL